MVAYEYDEISHKLRAPLRVGVNWALSLGLLLCVFFWAGIGAAARLF
jgi:hypothetical protein